MSGPAHGSGEFLRLIAPHVVGELRPPGELKKFTSNPDVVGKYIEAGVRKLIRRHVSPLRVSTGAVIDERNTPGDRSLPQLDTIVWTPSPVPAVFEAGDFGLVPRSSALGIVEVKSSAYAVAELSKRLTPDFVRANTADAMPEEEEQLRDRLPALGVICLLMHSQRKALIANDTNLVVALFEESGDAVVPRHRDIMRLVNFLALLRFRGRVHDGLVQIDLAAFSEQ